MEATKKTTATRAALLVVAALSMLLSGLFVATASRSDASPPAACPDGFALTADGKNCFQAAVVTSTDNPNSCAEGLITPDGSKCYVAARVVPQEGSTECPKGYSPDDSLGGICARFEAASVGDATCPEGSRGVVGGCYILVAKGPRGELVCTGDGSLAGDICVTQGADPVRAAGTCPSDPNIIQSGCFRIVQATTAAGSCGAATAPYADDNGICKFVPATAGTSAVATTTCPASADGATPELVTFMTTHEKVGFCEVTPVGSSSCPNGSDDVNGDASECRVAVPLNPGALTCPDPGFGIVDGKCIAQSGATVPAPQCPAGSFEDGAGQCRKPVADAPGSPFCPSADSALNGKSCVFTAPFTVNFAEDAYVCDNGTRAVVGDQVLCFLGDADANTDSGPTCLQGVLSTDGAYCIVPRVDAAPAAAAAPVPSFTG